MKSLAIISFAIVAAAFAGQHEDDTNKPLCDCDQMKTCLQEKLQEHDQTRTRCDQQCVNQLPHHDKMEQCLKAKWTKTDQMLQKMLDCTTTGDDNMCKSSSGTQAQAEYKPEHDSKAKNDMIEELKPYVECMKSCMNMTEEQDKVHLYDKEAKERHEPKSGWKQFTHQMWGGIKKCKKTLNCKLEHDVKKASATNCMQSTGVNKNQYSTVKQDFCKCARGALGKTEEEMPCELEVDHTEEPHATTHAH